jgi:hypothetical protein
VTRLSLHAVLRCACPACSLLCWLPVLHAMLCYAVANLGPACCAVVWSAPQLLSLTLLFSLLPVKLLTTSLAVNWSLDCRVKTSVIQACE